MSQFYSNVLTFVHCGCIMKLKIDKKMYNALMGVVHFLYHMVILIER